MNRIFLFIGGLALPTLQTQAAEMDGFARENWPDVAAGGGRLFFALFAGILLAFAIQWVLTCLSVATGATAAGKATRRMRRRSYYPEDRWRDGYGQREPGRDRDDREKDLDRAGYREDRAERERLEKEREETWEKPVQKVQAGVGAWVLVTASISTFLAAWMAAELIRFGGRTEAIILGLAVWSGFMFGMMWLEATLIGSLLGNLFGAFKSGLRTASAPFKAAVGAAGNAASASAEEIAAKVREEFRSQGGASGIKDKLKEYMDAMQPRTFEKDRIEREVDDLFDDAEIREAARQGAKADRRKFQEIVAGRGDLPQDEQRMLVDVLHDRWHHAVEESRRDGSWTPAEARAESQVPDLHPAESPDIARTAPAARAPEIQKTYSAGPYAAASGSQIAYGRGTRVAGTAPDFSARFQAFKDFLRSADKRELNPLRLEQEVESVVIHPEEGFANMERSVRDMKREEVSQALKQRRDITLEEADSISDLIDAARTRMLSRSEIREHRVQETSDKALAKIRDYVYSLKRPEIDLEGFKGDIARMLEDPKSGLESLKSRAAGVDKESLIEAFAAKKGISRDEAERMADHAEQALKAAEENARRIEEETRRRLESAKRSAMEQAEATRKVAASAAWWLLAVAAATAAAAALGGLAGAST